MRRDGDLGLKMAMEKQRDDPRSVLTGRLEVVDLGSDKDGDPVSSCVFLHVPDEDLASLTPEERKQRESLIDQKAVTKAMWRWILAHHDDDPPPPVSTIERKAEIGESREKPERALEWLRVPSSVPDY